MDTSMILEYWPVLTMIGSLGAAWGGTRVAMNGTKEALVAIRAEQIAVRTDLAKHEGLDSAYQLQVIDRLSRIEGLLEDKPRRKRSK